MINTLFLEHIYDYRVYTEDTDLMGIVYHANYLKFFERARTEILRANDLSLTLMAEYDTHFAIRDIHICYRAPARLDDVLTVNTICMREKACGLLFKQKMANQLNELLSEATIHVVCVNQQLKPKRLPDVMFA